MPRMAERLSDTFMQGRNNEKPYKRKSRDIDAYIRTNSRNNSGMSSNGNSPRKITLVETDSGHVELRDERDARITNIIADANMDGVRHLGNDDPYARRLWITILVVFLILALIQIYSQIRLYYSDPVATNIQAEYPQKIAFPAVAVCNNNQFRLTYITGANLNRRARFYPGSLKSTADNSSSIFDKILRKTWDLDAVRFLKWAAHFKKRMILGCTWPNGTSCSSNDFKPVWTMSGLCYAINTDPHNPFEVTGSGLKILIYNQTDIPESSLDGVNVPTGYAMDIPFKMQHRRKLPGVHCIQESEEQILARNDFNSPDNIRTCTIRKYMMAIEEKCDCTMRKAFNADGPEIPYNACNVDDYFGCVVDVIQRVREIGTASECLPPCEAIDYTAWQDMNRLPTNIMPSVIEEQENEDETDVAEVEADPSPKIIHQQIIPDAETFSCEENQYLTDAQVMEIKRQAHSAYEKQSRYQEDIFLRTKRRISRLNAAIEKRIEKMWNLYLESNYHFQLTVDHGRMDRIVNLMLQYEQSKLQRRAWAEKMQSRQMRHFFEEDFYDDYYQVLMKDMDTSLVKAVSEVINTDWPEMEKYLISGSGIRTGAMLFFEKTTPQLQEKFRKFINDLHECTTGPLLKEANVLLREYRKLYRELQASYQKLFKEELPDYLENFDFGPKFVSENFAMANVYLHKMHLEKWRQDRTYGFWSLALFALLQTRQFDVPGAKRKDNQEEGSLGFMQFLLKVTPTMNLSPRAVSQLEVEVSFLHTVLIRSRPGPGEVDTPILHASRPHDANEYFNNMQLPGPPTYELPSDDDDYVPSSEPTDFDRNYLMPSSQKRHSEPKDESKLSDIVEEGSKRSSDNDDQGKGSRGNSPRQDEKDQKAENELQTRGRLVSNALKERDNCIVLKVDTHMEAVKDMSPFGFHFELDKKIYTREKKRRRWKKFTKWFSWIAYYHHKFGIRHITLVLVLISYVFIGGAIFEALEADNELEDLKSTIMLMNGIIYEEVGDIKNLTGTSNLPEDQDKELTDKLAKLIKRYYKTMLEAEGRFHGSVWHKAENLDMHLMWYFSSATFYSMTLFSTIGYGTITCQTFWGRTVSIIYASLGLPLMLVVLGDIGEWFQKFLTTIYIFFLFKIKQWRKKPVPKDKSKIFLPMWIALTLVLGYIVICSLIIKEFDHSEGHRPGIGYSDAFYFTFISLTTIGLGDVMPYNIQYSPILSATFLLGLALISIVNTSIYAQMYGGFFKMVQDVEQFLDRVHKHTRSKGQGYHVFREMEPCLRLLVCSFPHIGASKRKHLDDHFRDSFRLRDKLRKSKKKDQEEIARRRTISDVAAHGDRKVIISGKIN
ncbi:hypothetical protein WR25_22865 isoform A [Diploscapter pachys]|uniref:Potassium channel domain-containing protein n=1 Tax=Diploscapter pachys TaxID=2018661 RepID=A0A2A2KQ70_9BILA|nr:hypothetical protein WR25_22865 isoform A [Diploscapter pachys]